MRTYEVRIRLGDTRPVDSDYTASYRRVGTYSSTRLVTQWGDAKLWVGGKR